MSTLWDLYEVDPDKYDKGVPVKIGDATFYVRSSGEDNISYKGAVGIEALRSPETREVFTNLKSGDNTLRALVYEPAISIAAMYLTVVTGWEGVTDRQGNLLPFTRENYIEVMRCMPSVFLQIRDAAADFSNFRVTRVEEAAENLGKSSDGEKSGESGPKD